MLHLKPNPPIEGITITVPAPDTITLVSGSGAFVASIDTLRKLNEQGIDPGDLTSLIAALEEQEDEAGHMVSVVNRRSGIDNTLFASTKGNSRHAARIKIAVDPPDSLNEASDGKASMALHDYSTVGAYVPPRLVEEVKAFIELNRAALMAYWNAEIDTESFLERLTPIPSKK
jgi:hypothetical protein